MHFGTGDPIKEGEAKWPQILETCSCGCQVHVSVHNLTICVFLPVCVCLPCVKNSFFGSKVHIDSRIYSLVLCFGTN